MSGKINELISKAVYCATLADPIRNYRLGAVAVHGQQCYYGWNSYRTHPIQRHFGKNAFAIHLHAEIAAMIKAKWKADVLVVVRLMADGSLGMAKPCSGCTRALSNVNEIWYSNSTGILDKL